MVDGGAAAPEGGQERKNRCRLDVMVRRSVLLRHNAYSGEFRKEKQDMRSLFETEMLPSRDDYARLVSAINLSRQRNPGSKDGNREDMASRGAT